MRQLAVIFVLVTSVFGETAFCEDFDITHEDHELHMVSSYALSLTAARLFENADVPREKAVLYSSLITLGVGLAKEYFIDSQPSKGDIIADALGTGVAALFIFSFKL